MHSGPKTLTQKIIESHIREGEMTPGSLVGLRIDQTLTQDATGTMVMLELEALGIDRARTDLSAQYVDHNLLQEDHKNPEDHLFLKSACERFGLWYSRPGNGVSHPVHQAHFGVPGLTLLGSDSHTCAAGAIGMLAIGAGGIEVALAIRGEPFFVRMPEVWGVELTGELPDWVSAKDVILEMLRRHDVKGGVGRVVEYYGEGVKQLSTMDRHVICNMGAELGATTSIFPSDDITKAYLETYGRGAAYRPLAADANATYDHNDRIDLSTLEPLIAMPSSPGNVVPVSEVAGEKVYQSYIGSSANPGYRDIAVVAKIVENRAVHSEVSLDINPTSREILEQLTRDSHIASLIHAGARLHQAGCNGCIGMGQAPPEYGYSLRTVPRNFKGRSGTEDDKVCLCSPETAAAAALTGVISDPRTLDMAYPKVGEGRAMTARDDLFVPPLPLDEARDTDLNKGENIASLPDFDEVPDRLRLPVLLRVGDNISTDDIMPAGANVLPFRSNVPSISRFVYRPLDKEYVARADETLDTGHVIAGGENYGQGSSREHAAIAPRYLGLRAVIAKSYARIHWQNLINWGVLPLVFKRPEDLDTLEQGATLSCDNVREQMLEEGGVTWNVEGSDKTIATTHNLTPEQLDILLSGGIINHRKAVA